MKTIEINCLECGNCTGESCKVYGSDADKAVKSCADDSFKNYKPRMTREEAVRVIEGLPVMRYMKKNEKQTIITTALDKAIEALQEPEREYGHWEHLGGDEWCCTACGHVISTEGSWEEPTAKYCEECGADLRGEENGTEEECSACQHSEKSGDQYPCCYCRNCYASKFQAKLGGRENENHGR